MLIKDEQKKIIDLFDDLLPWDKHELILYLVENHLEQSQFENVCKDLGFINYDDIDFVKEVVDNNLIDEVLDEMSEYDILDYLLRSSFNNSSDNLKDWLERMDWDDVADALAKLNNDDLNRILDSLYNNHSSKTVEILEHFIEKLK